MKSRSKSDRYLIRIGIGLLISALVLFIISLILKLESIQNWYAQYSDLLYSVEMAVISIDNIFLIVLTILLIFALKSILPIIPFSAICLVSGIVLPAYQSVIVNLIGSSIWLLIKYLWGYALGSGYIKKILRKYKKIRDVLESNGNGNPWLLFAFRAVPYFPLNTVSQLYGSMHFNVFAYLGISLLGLLPRIIAYAFVSGNVFDPFSFAFYMPIIALLIFMGISTLILGIALNRAKKILPRKDD